MRTCPPAKDTAKYHCKQDDKYDECYHAYAENEKILRPEDHSENDEFSFKHIKHDQWLIIYFNKWKSKKYDQVKNAEPGT